MTQQEIVKRENDVRKQLDDIGFDIHDSYHSRLSNKTIVHFSIALNDGSYENVATIRDDEDVKIAVCKVLKDIVESMENYIIYANDYLKNNEED